MDIIILVFAIVYAIRRGARVSMRAEQYPHAPPDKFDEWKQLELQSRDTVMWVGFGWVAVEVVASLMLDRCAIELAVLTVPLVLLVLIISAVTGSKAARIKKATRFGNGRA